MNFKQWWLPVVLVVAVSTPGAAKDLPTVRLQKLPVEARTTYQLILKGGPFPYAKDGSVFQNREKLLPIKPRNHYREYTVPTPGVNTRGARRIICGPVMDCFYTSDHYRSFRRIVK
ncbi:ribonuclease domain-containing protein [Deinococcus cellulosilyticus]|uniref:Uncharacterized protein n=1 Tax=Deinococcus cellulosilyticus (strain DSM 18568 / NBRC 106333 / KACC 11606 / 5516J-15) TaxID=1223518 RepID=A0A511NB34_DEIC1|nr:ribonuclease domain-containing protein [Deinococcus cellulosilyticus]GEM49591.1 hypothetical protein DC3_52260 [Deinococcus cellulosilyticus NBRC 106333 = KACC 11606]